MGKPLKTKKVIIKLSTDMFASLGSWPITFTCEQASDVVSRSQVQNNENEVALQARSDRGVDALPWDL